MHDQAGLNTPMPFELIVRSLDISVLTHGAFDITFDSVVPGVTLTVHRADPTATVGIDVAHKVGPIMEAAFGKRRRDKHDKS